MFLAVLNLCIAIQTVKLWIIYGRGKWGTFSWHSAHVSFPPWVSCVISGCGKYLCTFGSCVVFVLKRCVTFVFFCNNIETVLPPYWCTPFQSTLLGDRKQRMSTRQAGRRHTYQCVAPPECEFWTRVRPGSRTSSKQPRILATCTTPGISEKAPRAQQLFALHLNMIRKMRGEHNRKQIVPQTVSNTQLIQGDGVLPQFRSR
jgi:hypothetical protein